MRKPAAAPSPPAVAPRSTVRLGIVVWDICIFFLGWYCPRRERPRDRRAAEQRDERALVHSITSSAMASSPGERLRLNALAVLRLITNSNLLDCMTGRSAGFSPLRMRPVYTPAWRYASLTLVP